MYHARGNKYISNSRRIFDVYVFVLNSTFSSRENFSRMCIRTCYTIHSCEKRRVCVSNSKLMVPRIFTYVYVY